MDCCTTSTVRRDTETVPWASKPRVCGVAGTKDKVKRELTLKIILRFPPKGCGARALPRVTIRKGEKGEREETLLSHPQSTWCQVPEIKDQGKLASPSETQPAASGHLWWQAKFYHLEALVSRILLHSLPITHSNFSYPETKLLYCGSKPGGTWSHGSYGREAGSCF